jgi:hypothetical protein
MTRYYTRTDALRAARDQTQFGKSARVALESASLESESRPFDVFLSHSVKDADEVYGVKLILEDQGLSVYVDWIDDPKLDRSHVTAQTAGYLRKRMDQCHSLIYIWSSNATTSRWMPWELGYFDGHRGADSVAIMPLMDNESDSFRGQEYVGFYSVVEKDRVSAAIAPGTTINPLTHRWMPLRQFGDLRKQWKTL